jgi:hypothetical protein
MKFEVINDKGKTVYYTHKEKDIPNKEYLNSMSDAGYKFKIDGKVASKKKVEELIK